MHTIYLPSFLALAECFSVAHGHSGPSGPSLFGLDSALSARLRFFLPHASTSSEHSAFSPLDTRASNTSCGIQNGNTSCAAGLCCSVAGQCGIGRAFCDAPYCQFEFGPACDANMSPQGTNTSSLPRPVLGTVKYATDAVIKNCTKPGHVALTFDDGPYHYTSELLDILKANNVPATFFVTANNIGKNPIDWLSTGYPPIIQRMITDGHQVGSHTWSHQNLNVLSTLERRDQMIKNEMALTNILGFFPTYMRPPYGSCQFVTGCADDIGTLGYHIIEFNVDTNDFVNLTPDSYPLTQGNVTQGLKGGNPAHSDYIIYAHDILPLTVQNLTQWIIDTVKGQGYQFVMVGDCLGDPKTNWYRDPSTGNGLTDIVVRPANASLSLNGTPSSASYLGSAGTASVSGSAAAPTSSTVTGTASSISISSSSTGTYSSNASSLARSGLAGLSLTLLIMLMRLFW